MTLLGKDKIGGVVSGDLGSTILSVLEENADALRGIMV